MELDGERPKAAIDLIADAKCAQIRAYEAEFGPWDGLRTDCARANEVQSLS